MPYSYSSMFQKKEKNKNKEEGEKKRDGNVGTAVFKFDMHCEGCAKKLRKSISNIPGVESVKTDCSTNKLVATGNVDPVKIKARVEEKTKKNVELVSFTPTNVDNGGGGGGKKSIEKISDDKMSSDSKEKQQEKPKEPSVSTVQLKTRVHCDGCAHKIKKIVGKFEGVQDVNVDLQKDLITAKGTMNMVELLPYLNIKLKRAVEITPPPNKDAGRDNKPKEGGANNKQDAGSGEKGKGATASTSAAADTSRIEVSKMEYNPINYDYGYGYAQAYDPRRAQGEGYAQVYDPRRAQGEGYAQVYDPRRPQGEGYGQPGMEYWHAPNVSHPPQMFSDENPNACSLM